MPQFYGPSAVRHAASSIHRLVRYRSMRDFTKTTKPSEGGGPHGTALLFVIQKHAASRNHYDFRLELDGVLLSWAMPRGPSFDPKQKRMAVRTEDHPLEYARFEGTIPPKQYGAGTMIVWDPGTWEPTVDPSKKGWKQVVFLLCRVRASVLPAKPTSKLAHSI